MNFFSMTTFLLISLAQGVVVLPFLFVQITVPVVCVSLMFFPVHIFHAYWSLVVTPRLGPNLKVLGLMLLPVPLLLSPLLHIAFTVIFVTIIGPESMVFANFLENETGLTLKAILFGNVGHPFHYGLKYVRDYTDWYSKSIVDSLVDFRSGPENGAFDIAIIQIFTGVLQSVTISAILIASFAVVGGLKMPFVILHALYCYPFVKMVKGCCPCILMIFLGYPFITIVVPFGYVISLPYAGLLGTVCAVESYHKSSLMAGFTLMSQIVQKHNNFTNAMMGIETIETIETIEVTAPQPNITETLVRMKAIWDSFFKTSLQEVSSALEKGWITEEEVSDLEPFLFVGVPALVTFHCVSRSLEQLGKAPRPVPGFRCDARRPSKYNAYYTGQIVEPEGKETIYVKFDEDGDKTEEIPIDNVIVHTSLWLYDGAEINEKNRPHNSLADLVFDKMSALMISLEDCSESVTGREDELRKAILRNDMASFVEERPSPSPSIAKLFGGLFDVAVSVSRAPTFQRRFKAVLDSAFKSADDSAVRAAGDSAPMQQIL